MDTTTYYAVVDPGGTPSDSSGLVRRRIIQDGGLIDEALQQNLNWAPTSAIAEWRRGALDFDLIEISTEAAQALIQKLGEKWDWHTHTASPNET